MGRPSLKKLMKKVEKRKDISEEEKESMMEKMRKLNQERDELRVQLNELWAPKGCVKTGKRSLKKLMDIPEEEKKSMMEKISKLDKEKDELLAQIDSNEWKRDRVQEEEEMSETVEGGKENEEDEDELQIKMGRIQKENDELQVELKWRKTHKYADDITLDAGTAHPNLSISGDKKFTHEAQPQNVPSTPERFDSTVCVLGSEGFSSGKHYWEVEVVSSNDWDLGVARESIQRKGKLSLSPKEGFWALGFSGRDYWAKTDPWTRIEVQKKPKKIGVYLSYQEGQVTFFNVTDMSVLFTFNDCSFSDAVFPFFKNSHKGTSMRICSLREDE